MPITRETTWGAVAVGSYVHRYDVGRTYEIRAEAINADGAWVLLRDIASGSEYGVPRPAPSTPCVVLEPTEDDAVAVLQRNLGAEVEAKREGDGLWHVLPFPARGLVTGRMHLFLMHGLYTEDVKTHRELVEAHKWSHAEESQPWYQPHVHDLNASPE